MPRTKDQAVFGINSFSQTGIKNMFAKLASTEVEKVLLITKDGSCTVVQPTTDMETHHINKIDGVFENVVLLKKGQNIDIEKNAIHITSESSGSLLESIINTVRDKVELARQGLSFPDSCRIVIGEAGKLKDHFPQADSPQEYAEKILPAIFKNFEIYQPEDSNLESITQPFQIIVPGAYREIGFDGKTHFTPSQTMLFIEVSPSRGEVANVNNLSHKISVTYLDYQGKKQSFLGSKFFEWKMNDPSISKNQLVFGGLPENLEDDGEEIEDEEEIEIEDIPQTNGISRKKVGAK